MLLMVHRINPLGCVNCTTLSLVSFKLWVNVFDSVNRSSQADGYGKGGVGRVKVSVE